jgi:hypothetical protein
VLRFAADETLNNDILRALLRRRPDIDIVRVQDVGLSGAPVDAGRILHNGQRATGAAPSTGAVRHRITTSNPLQGREIVIRGRWMDGAGPGNGVSPRHGEEARRKPRALALTLGRPLLRDADRQESGELNQPPPR